MAIVGKALGTSHNLGNDVGGRGYVRGSDGEAEHGLFQRRSSLGERHQYLGRMELLALRIDQRNTTRGRRVVG